MKKRQTGGIRILEPLALIVFTLFIYAPVTVYLGNQTEYDFALADFLPYGLLLAVPGALVAIILWLALRGRARDAWSAALFGIGAALFLQGNFLNPDYGVLDGRRVQWGQYALYAAGNTAIWTALVAGPVLMALKDRGTICHITRWCALSMIAYEAIVLAVTVAVTPVQPHRNAFVVGDRNSTTLSSNRNTIVFLVDACDTDYVRRILDDAPQDMADWDGFVYYPDFVGSYSKTRMSVPYILTGKWYENDRTMEQFVQDAYEDVALWDTLAEAGYDIGVYTHREYLNEGLVGRFGNLIATRLVVADPIGLARQWLKLTCFNYCPHLLKPAFEFYSGDFSLYYGAENGEEIYGSRNKTLAKRVDGELKLTEKNAFRFYHVRGSHLPCDMDAEGNNVGDWKSNAYDQTRGVFGILTRFMNRMKRLGIYDRSTVIVMADHGRFDEGLSYPAFLIKRPGAHGAVKVCDTPASQTELHATILQCAGLEVPEGMTSIFDLDPDSDYPRRFMYYPISYNNRGFLPDLEEYAVSRGLKARATGRWYTRLGVVEK